jgi:hypothetical protein
LRGNFENLTVGTNNSAKQVVSQEKAAAAVLRAQIVDDPEQLRRVIADMRDSMAREVGLLRTAIAKNQLLSRRFSRSTQKESAAAAEQQCHALQEKLNALTQIEKDIGNSNKLHYFIEG